MKELFKRTTTSIIISAVIAFVLGLLMAVVPNISLQVIGIVFGIYIIIHGIVLIALDFMTHNIFIPFHGIISGILSIVVGLILVAMPNVLSTVFTIALGIWIILSSVNIISISPNFSTYPEDIIIVGNTDGDIIPMVILCLWLTIYDSLLYKVI